MKIIVWNTAFQFTRFGFEKLKDRGWRTIETFSYIKTLDDSFVNNPSFIVDRLCYDEIQDIEMGHISPFGRQAFIRTFYADKDKDKKLWKNLMSHPDLIELIETYGELVIHPASKMKVITIPNDIDWDLVVNKQDEMMIIDRQKTWKIEKLPIG